MNYQELSPQGETLLKEIIDLQASGQDNGQWSGQCSLLEQAV